jgi:GntR family transcriptional regulator
LYVDTPIRFQVNTGAPDPIYRQLMEQVRRRVAAGQWVAGQELPSVREVALQLAVHPMTISKAYGLLEMEGLLERRRGLPMVIAAGHRKPAAARDRIEQLRPALERAAAAARELAIPKAQVLQLLERLLDASDTGTEP